MLIVENMYGVYAPTHNEKALILFSFLTMDWGKNKALTFLTSNPTEDSLEAGETFSVTPYHVPYIENFLDIYDKYPVNIRGIGEDEYGNGIYVLADSLSYDVVFRLNDGTSSFEFFKALDEMCASMEDFFK